MKNLIILFFVCISLLYGQNVQAQFDVSTGTDKNETIMVDGTSYDVFASSGGSLYIICNSPRTGNDYAVWIGTPASNRETHEDKPVRVSKNGTKFILIKSKNTNNPYPKYFEKKTKG